MARVRAKTQLSDAEVPTLPIPHFLPITRWWVCHGCPTFACAGLSADLMLYKSVILVVIYKQ